METQVKIISQNGNGSTVSSTSKNSHRTPLQRIARVNDLDPVLPHKEGISDPVEEAINKFSFSVQTLVVVFLLTMLWIIGVWVIWNVKNTLHIDLMSGSHHGLIDEINKSLGL